MSGCMTAVLRSLAVATGIPVCHQQNCENVGTHIAAWVTGDLTMCEPCARRAAGIGELLGVHNVTIRDNPDAPRPRVPLKRFQAIGRDIAGDP